MPYTDSTVLVIAQKSYRKSEILCSASYLPTETEGLADPTMKLTKAVAIMMLHFHPMA